MNPRSLMLMAAGNMPAALYHERKVRRWSNKKIDGESAEARHGNWAKDDDKAAHACHLQPLKTFQPTAAKLHQIVHWLYKASDAELTTCKIGLATAGNGLVSWSYRTRVSRPSGKGDQLVFTGKFAELPVGTRFSKIVLTMANGDEIARRALDHSIEVTEGVCYVSASYTLRFN
jgi:hypothetical protein